jgi:hypothetical protein
MFKSDLNTVLHRTVVRSATNPMQINERVTFKSDVQETFGKLDTIPGAVMLSYNHL